jgi:hypothetical protein
LIVTFAAVQWTHGRWLFALDETETVYIVAYAYSASQISTWLDCPRKWGWDKLNGIKGPANASAEWGTRMHEMVEHYLKTGEPIDHVHDPDMAARVSGALHLLPEPKSPGLSVELSFFERLNDAPRIWSGRIDYLVRDSGALIGDHKSTSSIAKWAKTEADLLEDPQANIYGKWVLRKYPELHAALGQWEYIQSKGPKRSEAVMVPLHRSRVDAEFARIDAIAAQIDAWRNAVSSAEQLPYNPESCEKYGGCAYRHMCNLSPEESLKSYVAL